MPLLLDDVCNGTKGEPMIAASIVCAVALQMKLSRRAVQEQQGSLRSTSTTQTRSSWVCLRLDGWIRVQGLHVVGQGISGASLCSDGRGLCHAVAHQRQFSWPVTKRLELQPGLIKSCPNRSFADCTRSTRQGKVLRTQRTPCGSNLGRCTIGSARLSIEINNLTTASRDTFYDFLLKGHGLGDAGEMKQQNDYQLLSTRSSAVKYCHARISSTGPSCIFLPRQSPLVGLITLAAYSLGSLQLHFIGAHLGCLDKLDAMQDVQLDIS
jgi:hypothetical protein